MHGVVFHTINSSIDSVFETLYTLFPLIYLTSGDSIFDLRSLGLLKRQNWFILLQSLVAMILLLNKCIKMTIRLNPVRIAQKYQYLKQHYNGRGRTKMPWYAMMGTHTDRLYCNYKYIHKYLSL